MFKHRSYHLRFLKLLKLIFATFFTTLLTSSGFASSVSLSWDANSENDLAGYKVYYGTNSRDYQESLYVGNITAYQIDGLKSDSQYFFAVTAIDLSGNESNFSDESGIYIPKNDDDKGDDGNSDDPPVSDEALLQPLAYNFPNPFKVGQEQTLIRYELKKSAEVTIKIFDVNSNIVTTLVKKQGKRQGEHTEDFWDGKNRYGDYVANGVYFCSIQAENEQKVIKIAVSND